MGYKTAETGSCIPFLIRNYHRRPCLSLCALASPFGRGGRAQRGRRGFALHLKPHPNRRKQYDEPFPPGEGQVRTASGHSGLCWGNRVWADVPQSAPTKRRRRGLVRRMRFLPAFLIRRFATPSPPGEGQVRTASGHLGCVGGIGFGPMCLNRPLRIGGGTDLYRKSDYCPHS